MEGAPLPPGLPGTDEALAEEVKRLGRSGIIDSLVGWGSATLHIEKERGTLYLLILDINSHELAVRRFLARESSIAEDALLKLEKQRSEGVDAVLVSAESVSALKKAFPNYFGDTALFIGLFDEFAYGRKIDPIIDPR
jgi:hypothetical protein